MITLRGTVEERYTHPLLDPPQQLGARADCLPRRQFPSHFVTEILRRLRATCGAAPPFSPWASTALAPQRAGARWGTSSCSSLP